MTSLPSTIEQDTVLSGAAAIMTAEGVRHLPVLREGGLVGMLSERDVNVVRSLRTVTLDTITAGKVMTDAPLAVGPRTPLSEVVSRMAEKRIGSAVVVEEGRVVGIFTTVDALHALQLVCRAEGVA
jgi:acetoin utilization protein AcuB